MGKKMKLIPFLSKSSTEAPTWPWRCGIGTPRTLSFRAMDNNGSKYFTIDSSINSDFDYPNDDECVEKVIKGLRSERLFFEPVGPQTRKFPICNEQIQEVVVVDGDSPFEGSVAMSVESTDPFVDFRRSMEEMVTAHHHEGKDSKLLDWEFLEDLLTCYLKINGRKNHGYIVGAFVDLMVSSRSSMHSSTTPENHDDDKYKAAAAIAIIASPSSSLRSSIDENCLLSCTNSNSFTSPFSFCSSTCSSTSPRLFNTPQEAEDDDETELSADIVYSPIRIEKEKNK